MYSFEHTASQIRDPDHTAMLVITVSKPLYVEMVNNTEGLSVHPRLLTTD